MPIMPVLEQQRLQTRRDQPAVKVRRQQWRHGSTGGDIVDERLQCAGAKRQPRLCSRVRIASSSGSGKIDLRASCVAALGEQRAAISTPPRTRWATSASSTESNVSSLRSTVSAVSPCTSAIDTGSGAPSSPRNSPSRTSAACGTGLSAARLLSHRGPPLANRPKPATTQVPMPQPRQARSRSSAQQSRRFARRDGRQVGRDDQGRQKPAGRRSGDKNADDRKAAELGKPRETGKQHAG